MAIAIRPIPELKGKEAMDFVLAAEASFKKRGTVDVSEQVRITKNILRKARL